MTTEYSSALFSQHAEKLRSSAISSEVAGARGYRSADTKAQLERLNFSPAQRRPPALVVPVWGVAAGEVVFHQARPDSPRSPSGRPIKYETVGGARMVLDCHPSSREALGDPAQPLVVTEGILKADALLSAGAPALGLLGVWNWRGRNAAGGLTALPDWEAVALNERLLYLAFDSDALSNEHVHKALGRLQALLESRGATVRICQLAPSGNGKVGVDDYLAAGGSLEELLARAAPRLPQLAPSAEGPENLREGHKPAPQAGDGLSSPDLRPTLERPPLASERDLLALFRRDVELAGLAGEQEGACLIYLMLTSRLLPWGKATNRPVSGLPKGTSSSGKSALVEAVCRFVPPSAYLNLGSMSRRYLVYMEEPLAHRFLIVPEYASIADDEEIVAMLRTLLSEGRVVHGTVDGEGKRTARRIEKEGPTGLLVTTTRSGVDPELETRCLSFTTDDSPEQTRRVFKALASLEEEVKSPVDFEAWQALQNWLAEAGEHRIAIPYVAALAELMPTGATRLRRDFVSLLCLLRAHALLHQATRDRDAQGRVLASIDDYAAVRALINSLVAEGVEEAAAPATVATVEAVRELLAEEPEREWVSPKAVAARLKIGTGPTYDRIKRALARGWLANRASKDERGLKLALGAALPTASEDYLPLPEAVQARAAGGGLRPVSGGATLDQDPGAMRVAEAVSGSQASQAYPPVEPEERPADQAGDDWIGAASWEELQERFEQEPPEEKPPEEKPPAFIGEEPRA